ncbi:MAG TPA: hypothetical protein VNM39_15080, partial [Verrucomicrobiae bacterium]|nr:hypothetical protein [Verrucomicrobiae bacterium]
MTRSVPGMGRAAVACVSALLAVALAPGFGLGPSVAHAARRPKAASTPDVDPARAGLVIVTGPNAASAALTPARAAGDPRAHALARAALEHARGDWTGVVDALAPLALERSRPDSLPADADRAAFLLGHA